MKLKNLRVIVVLMSLAVLGLIALQHAWMQSALRESSQQFDKQVYQALNQVVRKVADQEVYESALRTVEELVYEGDSVKARVQRTMPDSLSVVQGSRIHVFRSDLLELRAEEEARRTEALAFREREEQLQQHLIQKRKEVGTVTERWVMDDGSDTSFAYFREDMDTTKDVRVKVDRQIDGNTFTIVMRTDNLDKITLSSRLMDKQIDSLIGLALTDQGIDLPFEYGVIDLEGDSLALTNSTLAYPVFKRSPYRVNMFQDDLLRVQPALLSVRFPQKSAFMWRQIGGPLASSILLIGVILFCFVYAVRTILRQKKLSEIKNDFINNMTHEFKTPVATVGLAVEALQDNTLGELPDMRERYLQIIGDENRRLGMQVEKVLQIATLDRKELNLKLERIDVHAVIQQALEKINLQVTKREGRIQTRLEAVPAEVEADPLHLTNIVYNLLDNANKYSPEHPQIEIATRSQTNGLWISVADCGIGMTREVLSKIFEKFYRVPAGNVHDVKGFGLGLAYVKTMVEAHRGEVRVKSQPNEGSVFELFIPYRHG